MGTYRQPPASLRSALAAARQQGWQIEVVDLHTVKLSHPEAGIHVVDDRKGGRYARQALRRAMQTIREG